jgi:hypothetical protein
MCRRRFLRRLLSGGAAFAAGHVLDVERLLWVPGARTFFLPSPRSAPLLTIGDITRESMRLLKERFPSLVLPELKPWGGFGFGPTEGDVMFGVDAWVGPTEVIRSNSHIVPKVACLADRLKRQPLKQAHELPIGIAGVEAVVVRDAGSGLALRGSKFYDADSGRFRIRIEYAGASA